MIGCLGKGQGATGRYSAPTFVGLSGPMRTAIRPDGPPTSLGGRPLLATVDVAVKVCPVEQQPPESPVPVLQPDNGNRSALKKRPQSPVRDAAVLGCLRDRQQPSCLDLLLGF